MTLGRRRATARESARETAATGVARAIIRREWSVNNGGASGWQ
jgi:hypothetical protein